MSKYVAVSEMKAHLGELLHEVEMHRQRVVVQRRGRPVAVIQPYDPDEEAVRARHWAEQLDGITADIDDFSEIMRKVVQSRARSRSRAVDLDS
jgi:prevent-host-death family protein